MPEMSFSINYTCNFSVGLTLLNKNFEKKCKIRKNKLDCLKLHIQVAKCQKKKKKKSRQIQKSGALWGEDYDCVSWARTGSWGC